jgi:hypothetical protein
MCCVDDYDERPAVPLRPRECRKFIIIDEEENSRAFTVNISQFEVANEEIALCKLLIYLANKGLTVENRKFYMPKFNSVIQPFTFCRIKFSALNEKHVILRSYPENKENQEIYKENIDFEPVRLFAPKAFRPLTPSGLDMFSMAEEKFNMTLTFNPEPVQADFCCNSQCSNATFEDRCFFKRKVNNEEI